MKARRNFYFFFKIYLVASTILLYFFLSLNIYARTHDKIDISVTLRIVIDDKNNITGSLYITKLANTQTIENSLVILPFIIDNLSKGDAIITSDVHENYTILQIITSKNSSDIVIVKFHIISTVIDISQVNRDQDTHPDFFLIEQRGTGLYTLDFRYDTAISDMPFGDLAGLMQNMIIPSKIVIDFPKDAIFTTIPPIDYEPYNVQDGNHPGTYKDNEFTTTVDFYQTQPLRVNYSLPQPLPPLPSVFIIITLSLSLLIPTVLSFPEEIVSKKWRIRCAAAIDISIPLILFGIITVNGIEFTINYFKDNYSLLIPGIFIFILSSIILIFRVPLMKRLLRYRIVLQVQSAVQPHQNQSAQPQQNQGTQTQNQSAQPQQNQGTQTQNHP